MKIFLVLVLLANSAFGYDLELESGENQTQVIELYTSEGCSSCPPADRWLTSLKTHKGLWTDFIALSMHVDYWDYIGWKDEMALKNNSIRQQLYKLVGNLNSVYTPGVLKAGKEWRAWRFTEVINKSPINVGKLKVSIKNNQLISHFDGKTRSKHLNLNIALLGMNMSSKVRAGENKGKSLKHDFVLLKHQIHLSDTAQWKINLEESFFKTTQQKLAFVAWIEDEINPAPIQAVGLHL